METSLKIQWPLWEGRPVWQGIQHTHQDSKIIFRKTSMGKLQGYIKDEEKLWKKINSLL